MLPIRPLIRYELWDARATADKLTQTESVHEFNVPPDNGALGLEPKAAAGERNRLIIFTGDHIQRAAP